MAAVLRQARECRQFCPASHDWEMIRAKRQNRTWRAQRDQSSLWQVAIVLRHHGAAAGNRIMENEVTARCVIQNKAVLFQKPDDLTRLNGGELRPNPGRAGLRGDCRRWGKDLF